MKTEKTDDRDSNVNNVLNTSGDQKSDESLLSVAMSLAGIIPADITLEEAREKRLTEIIES